LEKRLVQRGGSAARLGAAWVELDTIRRAVPADGLLVEIVCFYPFRFGAKPDEQSWDSPRYAAWVIPPVGRGEVVIVDLGKANPIDAAVKAAREAVAGGAKRATEVGEPQATQEANAALQKVADRVLAPLRPHLAGVKTLLLSPDGDL